MAPLALVSIWPPNGTTCISPNFTTRKLHLNWLQIWSSDGNTSKEAAAFEAPSQTKEEFSGNDTSRHPKVFKLGPKLGYQ